MPHRILALSGSLRSASSNTGLIRMAAHLVATDPSLGIELVPVGVDTLPFYNPDLEDPAHTPTSVLDWRSDVAGCAGLFIASPEYNFGPTALIKNAVDWISRPPGHHVLRGKAISLVSSSASTGGKHMVEQLTHVMTLLGNTCVVDPEAMFVKGADRISADGTSTDPDVERIVRSRLEGLAKILETA